MFIVKVVCKEVLDADGCVFRKEDEEEYLCEDEWGVTAMSGWYNVPPSCVLTFGTREEALSFAEKWESHQWYIKPKSYEVLEVEPVYETKIVGWVFKDSVA